MEQRMEEKARKLEAQIEELKKILLENRSI